MKQKNSIRIKPIRQGVKIVFSAYSPDPIGDIAFSFFPLPIGLFPLVFVIFIGMTDDEGTPVIVLLFAVLVFCVFLLLSIVMYQNKHTMYKITMLPHDVAIGSYGLGAGKGTTYKIAPIRNLRLNTIKSFTKRHPVLADVLFEYELQTAKCCEGITYSDGEALLKSLNELIRFRCQSVSCIAFGQPDFSLPDEAHFLLNPDVSELTLPFYHLKTLVILTESYNFMLIERFLTYAINHIGRTYLKRVVEAHIYGNIEKLHPNIRNNVTTFCKKTYFHSEEVSYSALEKMIRD